MKQRLLRPHLARLGALALTATLGVSLGACAGPYATAWRTTEGVRQVGNQVDHSLGVVAQKKHVECVGAHGRQTEGYAKCIDKHRRALDTWRRVARPAVNSALAATVGAIQLAERVKSDKPVDWEALLRPAVCALARAVEQWGPSSRSRRSRSRVRPRARGRAVGDYGAQRPVSPDGAPSRARSSSGATSWAATRIASRACSAG